MHGNAAESSRAASRFEAFRQLCAQKGLSVTHQRQLIYEALMSMEGHPSPEAVYEQVRKQIPSISLATVYKNIHTFVEHGIVREVSVHHGSAKLETNLDPHHHLVCLHCKAMVDLPDDNFEPIRMKKRAPKGFLVHRYSVEVLGLCPDCAE